jgi:hypothetical protein
MNGYLAHRGLTKQNADVNFLDIEWSYLILCFMNVIISQQATGN